MHPEISKLLDLQTHDLELLDVDVRLLEVANKISLLDTELGKAQDAVTAAERLIEAERRKRDELESKIDGHRKHQEKRKEKLEFMKTPKEVSALMAEIDLARSVLSNEESEWVKSADQVGVLENRRTESEAQVAGVRDAQSEARAALEEKRQVLDQERRQVMERREASATQVNRALLLRYEKLRVSRRAAVVVALSGPACGACFTQVPLSRRTQIKAGAVIEGCESCGVILYASE